MQVQVNTDDNVTGRTQLAQKVEAEIRAALDRFADRITRIEVHLSDENSQKSGARDKRCMMEARLAGRAPIAVSDAAESLMEAVNGAADKLQRAVQSSLGREKGSHGRDSIRGHDTGAGPAGTGEADDRDGVPGEPR